MKDTEQRASGKAVELTDHGENGGRRGTRCPLCGLESELVLKLSFGKKLDLPLLPDLRVCAEDNFAFITGVKQSSYNDYYRSVINDYRHREVQLDIISPVKLQIDAIFALLPAFFSTERRVFDYGCGEGDLLLALAQLSPRSSFVGYDPSLAVATARKKILDVDVKNVKIIESIEGINENNYDLIILSHVMEHLIDFSFLDRASKLLTKDGLVFIEVPDALTYEKFPRRSFLYYFDRLHVNHFSMQALVRIMSKYGFGHLNHKSYEFPYNDGAAYPALAAVFKINSKISDVPSNSMGASFRRYISNEQTRSLEIAQHLSEFEGILVWGAGDNFYRSTTNGGPLSFLKNMILLDQTHREIDVGEKSYSSIDPLAGILQYAFPLALTVSEASSAIRKKIAAIDPARQVFLL